MTDGDGRAFRVRRTEGGRPRASDYSDDRFAIEVAAFALTEQGIPNVVEHRVGAGYLPWPPAPVVTVAEAAAAGHATLVDEGKGGRHYRLKPTAYAFLNPTIQPGNRVD